MLKNKTGKHRMNEIRNLVKTMASSEEKFFPSVLIKSPADCATPQTLLQSSERFMLKLFFVYGNKIFLLCRAKLKWKKSAAPA